MKYRESFSLLKKLGTVVLGISGDSYDKIVQFKRNQRFPFDLLSDGNHKVSTEYGAYDSRMRVSTRLSVLVDKEGVVEFTQRSAIGQVRNHEAMLQAVKKLAKKQKEKEAKKAKGSWGRSQAKVKARLVALAKEVRHGEKLALLLELKSSSTTQVSLPAGTSVKLTFEKSGEDPVEFQALAGLKEALTIDPKDSADLAAEEGWTNPEVAGEGEGKVVLEPGTWKVTATVTPLGGAHKEDKSILVRELKTGALKLKVKDSG